MTAPPVGRVEPSAVFDKRPELFPVRRDSIYLAHSSIGPMYAPAAEAARAFIQESSTRGVRMLERYGDLLTRFRGPVADLLAVDTADVAYVANTAAGIGMIANGYPFEPGDHVVSYTHEFPSNHYPWVLQERRGVELVQLGDVDPLGDLAAGGPRAWSMEELERVTTPRTRVVALSHVQFASGYAADLAELGVFCAERGIDLVVDAAQSLGALPVRPRDHGIAAVVGSAWKFLLGPRGGALLYVTPELRAKLRMTMAGDASMKHTLSYLDHSWEPFDSARRFEYSTLPWEHLTALEVVIREVFLRYGMDAVRAEIHRLQDVLIGALDSDRVGPVRFADEHRSGILALRTARPAAEVVRALARDDIVATSQGSYVRAAPHFYLDDDDMLRVAEALSGEG